MGNGGRDRGARGRIVHCGESEGKADGRDDLHDEPSDRTVDANSVAFLLDYSTKRSVWGGKWRQFEWDLLSWAVCGGAYLAGYKGGVKRRRKRSRSNKMH